MPAGPVEPSPTALTADEVLDELEKLACIEHSICVEYLSIHCALGHDLEPADDGVSAQHVAQAAQAASAAAFSEMRHVRVVNRVLVRGERAPQLGRASSIPRESSSDVALGPLTLEELERLLGREREIASAVDDLYARLRRAVESPSPMFEGELMSEVISVLSPGPDHSGLPSALTEELDGIPPSEYIVPFLVSLATSSNRGCSISATSATAWSSAVSGSGSSTRRRSSRRAAKRSTR